MIQVIRDPQWYQEHVTNERGESFKWNSEQTGTGSYAEQAERILGGNAFATQEAIDKITETSSAYQILTTLEDVLFEQKLADWDKTQITPEKQAAIARLSGLLDEKTKAIEQAQATGNIEEDNKMVFSLTGQNSRIQVRNESPGDFNSSVDNFYKAQKKLHKKIDDALTAKHRREIMQ